ncbi:MAG: hypothetical protein AAGG38_01370 [Planctomycetota bacterium]
MQTRVEPPLEAWPRPTARKPIWTGHQVSFFHPGIVAKYLAAQAVSARSEIPFHNIVVDQDVYDPLTLRWPQRHPDHPDRLTVERLTLGPVVPDVPVGMQPAVEAESMIARVGAMPAGLAIDRERLVAALRHSDRDAASLAFQMDRVLRRLLPGYAAAEPSAFASALLRPEAGLLDRLLRDAPRCAKLYNEAVRQHAAAGMSALSVEPYRVEAPLWALRWMEPRERVYVDLADSEPLFTTDAGEPIDPADEGVVLAPRALLMTALLRRPDRCGLFIHGTGGWAYDRITEAWWARWRGETLAPMAVVTADARLEFDAPTASPRDLERAVWWAHHLPHNLDRELGLTGSPAREKQALLDQMDDDRDPRRRRAAFEVIHQINRQLADAHPEALAAARRRLDRARAGVVNARVTRKRDWPFLLYPAEAAAGWSRRFALALPQEVRPC